ncbi:MAG: gliding motility-associated C-terminal domain-containing protein [Sphingobacteriales bacterium]
MFFKRLFLLIVFFFICNSLFAATFIVTSNADSGPGTLRQALINAAANGTGQVDFINFNLPLNATTIAVKTQLPDVTGNVIIDGTTQPGPFLGVSNAKVIITVVTPTVNLNAFTVSNLVGVNDAVEFYGLYIKGFSAAASRFGSAIITGANCKLVIGAPGKGNVISGNWYAIGGFLQNAVVQSNFIGADSDGVTIFANWSLLYSLADYDNLLIGGNAAGDGNVIEGGNNNGIDFGDGSANQINKSVTIQNNFFGTDYKGTTLIPSGSNAFVLVNDPNTTLNITGNVFSATQTAISAFSQATLIVRGNYFGIDKSATHYLGNGADAIVENTGINATIGGTTPADQNIFTGYINPIVAVNNSTTNVIQNEFYCNTNVQLADPSGTNYIRIISLLPNSVSGDAPPGATVQLYYYKTQCTTCNPNFCFATVTANTNGVWQYSGNIQMNVMASSTVNNNTFGFQPFTIGQNEVTITNYDCHHAGSIVFNEPRQGNFQFTWTDSNGKIIGHTQNINNLEPGTYSIDINEGGTCSIGSGTFTITSLLPKVYASTMQLNCNVTTGNFTTYPSTAPGFTVANYFWKDSTGTVLSNTNSVNNLPAGNYSLYITDSNGCNSDTVICQVLPPLATPLIDTTKVKINSADCAAADGSITGIAIANGGNANYGWSKVNGGIFESGQLNLTNAPAGQYYFYVDYDFNCPELRSQVFTINSINPVSINDSLVNITSSTCAISNGSIKGITAPGATTYQWFDANNKVVFGALDFINAPPGNYYLVASSAACSRQSKVYTINSIPPIQITPGSAQITNDECSLGKGSIQNITITGGVPPYTYTWLNASQQVAGNSLNLKGIGAGVYTLQVKDGTACGIATANYTVADDAETVPPPIADNLEVCSPGEVLVIVKNTQPQFGYRLYSTATSTSALDDQASGIFKVSATSSGSVYVTQYTGTCESARFQVNILVGLSSLNIPNTFTPNGDGINDIWVIKGIENYTNALVQVFNRFGQKVFESRGYATPFDGNSGGTPLPAGVYYYIINVNPVCSLLSGSLTLLR